MSKTELQLTIDWLGTMLDCELRGDSDGMDRAAGYAEYFSDLCEVIPVYSFSWARNLPYRGSDGFYVFVSCNKRDMQPYQCDTTLAESLADARQIAIDNVLKYGESVAIIDGETVYLVA